MTPTPSQQQAIDATAPNVAMWCSAGAGKTATLVRRVMERGPENSIILTFTQAGAAEFARRLAPHKPKFAGTCHSLMFRILQQFGDALNYHPGSIGIADEDTCKDMLKKTREKLGMQRRITDKKLMARDGDDAEAVWREFEFQLRCRNLVTYDQILVLGARLLLNQAVRDMWWCRDLLVDEAQDSAEVEWDIFRSFPTNNLFVVADPNQSIFGFRGGRPDLFIQFSKESETIRANETFRCAPAIVTAANRIIPSGMVAADPLRTPGFVTVTAHETDADERQWCAQRIHEAQGAGQTVAVLARTNWIVNEARNFCEGYGIKVAKPPRMDNVDEWKRVICLVGLLIDPHSDGGTERWLRLTKSNAEANKIVLSALSRGKELSQYAPVFPTCLNAAVAHLPVLLAKKGIGLEVTAAVQQRIDLMPDATFPDVLADLYRRDQWGARHDASGVVFSTVHGFKGREADVILVLGMEDGVFPQLKADSDPEEERRLCYVAVTRARHALHLSHARMRRQEFGPPLKPLPSRFLA